MDPLSFATELAQKVGNDLRDNFWMQNFASRLKADFSLVTTADLHADQKITNAIKENFPEDGILSEESAQILDQSDRAIWVIDPLDGTANFASGVPLWGVLIARLVNGWPDLGVIYFPVTGELYTARKEEGAFRNGKAISSLINPPISYFTCCSKTYKNYIVRVPNKTRIYGSVAFHLMLVATGSAILDLEVAPKIWDIAAGWIIVHEAGGEIKLLAGKPPFPVSSGVNYDEYNFSTLAGASSELLIQADTWIKPRG
jgi:myo-inositol-1(or 4)-monophosphatase